MEPIQPDFKNFQSQAKSHNVIPVYGRIKGIDLSPLEAIQGLSPVRPTFLLESLGPYGEFSRASFLGINPLAAAVGFPGVVEVKDFQSGRTERYATDPWHGLELLMDRYHPAVPDGLEDFWGGAVGFMGYDAVRSLERLPTLCPVDPEQHEMHFVICQDLLRFDRGTGEVLIISLALPQDGVDLETTYQSAVSRVNAMGRKLLSITPSDDDFLEGFKSGTEVRSNVSQTEFEDRVLRAKEYIRNGDIIQAVLSQRLSVDFKGDPLCLYRTLREINPSPYCFYLDLEDLCLVGASPEMLVRLTGDRIQVRPIAGTRPRGDSPEADEKLAEDLLNDPKEKAEHIMLVDLGRNDVGRVARLGSVYVPQLMNVELYSHVMHLVTHVEGTLDSGRKLLDVLRATFPAGTLSGAPKIRAMEIIEELETIRRGPYGGAVGYLSFSGDMDFCITIRTLVVEGDQAWVQAGGGIVADSVPETEYQETLHKARAVLTALQRGRME
ncbi:MAG: anthranilate synthase component I family protein [Deltaproteobacteria bacterium]|nr:anthranilate synthase component I family protein [Deltaproteobacteria bacterium]MBW2051234.1 anthranilate synthase component I family protein [Deltaproteobacteria bacterium]MBW2141095.1 anthranilate synthase component I family protein [Deltaproteobacteria bacterium]MBW2322973.1 anthranilate synthase component I family protein [Deltaproteobacteria bacterium]